jgi:hypothetical protein
VETSWFNIFKKGNQVYLRFSKRWEINWFGNCKIVCQLGKNKLKEVNQVSLKISKEGETSMLSDGYLLQISRRRKLIMFHIVHHSSRSNIVKRFLKNSYKFIIIFFNCELKTLISTSKSMHYYYCESHHT